MPGTPRGAPAGSGGGRRWGRRTDRQTDSRGSGQGGELGSRRRARYTPPAGHRRVLFWGPPAEPRAAQGPSWTWGGAGAGRPRDPPPGCTPDPKASWPEGAVLGRTFRSPRGSARGARSLVPLSVHRPGAGSGTLGHWRACCLTRGSSPGCSGPRPSSANSPGVFSLPACSCITFSA